VVEPGARGPGWDPEGGRHLVEGQVQVVPERDDCPLLRGQATEGALELVTVRDRYRGVGDRRMFGREGPDGSRPAALPSRFGVAGVDHQAVKPRIEALDLAEVG
jgi:hypothetical protein